MKEDDWKLGEMALSEYIKAEIARREKAGGRVSDCNCGLAVTDNGRSFELVGTDE